VTWLHDATEQYDVACVRTTSCCRHFAVALHSTALDLWARRLGEATWHTQASWKMNVKLSLWPKLLWTCGRGGPGRRPDKLLVRLAFVSCRSVGLYEIYSVEILTEKKMAAITTFLPGDISRNVPPLRDVRGRHIEILHEHVTWMSQWHSRKFTWGMRLLVDEGPKWRKEKIILQ
jgi:hypothetical protein